jgi:excisionase family DNA binding protein
MNPKELLSMAQAAKEIGITRAGVLYAIKEDLLKAKKHGPYYLITRDEVERYKKQRPAIGRPRKDD